MLRSIRRIEYARLIVTAIGNPSGTEHTAIGDLSWELPGYVLGGYAVATMIGMVVYTLCNFVFNRMVTFR